MRKSCKGCIHCRQAALYTKCCHYILDTEQKRNSDPANCDKYAKEGYIITGINAYGTPTGKKYVKSGRRK